MSVKYVRMPIEKESPEQLGYDKIKYNLTESSVRDRSLKDLNMDVNDILLCYGDHVGNPGLREIISAENGNLNPENVLVTAGASAALFIVATSLLKNGDHMVVVRPNYATNIEIPKAIGCDITYLDLSFDNEFRINLNEFESLIRPETKYISLTYPHNPTGVMIDDQALNRIVELVKSKGCLLLFDETYREMTFGKMLPIAASLSPSVISVSSLSKTYGIPGIRLGWLICQDKDLMHLFLCAKEQIGICGSVIDEAIGYEALTQKDKWLVKNNKHIRETFNIVAKWIKNEELLEWIEPQGGCVCFPHIKPDVEIDIDRFYKTLNNKYGTYVGPGHWFEQSRRFFRIGYAWPLIDELTGGLDCLSKVLRESI
jgi:aspartate/methionine/tyrosine aminotransferase